MHFMNRKCLLLFLILSGGMQTVIVNAEEKVVNAEKVRCSFSSEDFTMDGDKIAERAKKCAEDAVDGFENVKDIVEKFFENPYANLSYAKILNKLGVKAKPQEKSRFQAIFREFLNYSFQKDHISVLTKFAETTIKANEILTYAVNAGASKDSLLNAEEKLKDARSKMKRWLSPLLNPNNQKTCKWAMDLLKELSDIDKYACESKRGRYVPPRKHRYHY